VPPVELRFEMEAEGWMSEALERLREKQGETDAADASVEPKNNRFAGNLDPDEADESNPRPSA
jgi:hypothetical protein